MRVRERMARGRRRFLSWLALGGLALACAVVPPSAQDAKPLFPAMQPGARDFVARKSVLLATRVVLRLHPDLYGEIKYRVDGNFHTFRETGNPPTSRLELRNVSTVQIQPVKLWVGEIEIAATDSIDAVFESRASGLEIDAFGGVFWNSQGESVRAERMLVRDGAIQFEGRR